MGEREDCLHTNGGLGTRALARAARVDAEATERAAREDVEATEERQAFRRALHQAI